MEWNDPILAQQLLILAHESPILAQALLFAREKWL
jgi:hypothetical protein